MIMNEVLLDSFTAFGAGLNDPGRDFFRLKFFSIELNYNPVPDENAADILQEVFKSLGLAPVQ